MQPHPNVRAVQDALTAAGTLDGAGEPSTVLRVTAGSPAEVA
ncbi:hypothetical protein AB0J84_24550 [Micromonospora arborensis]